MELAPSANVLILYFWPPELRELFLLFQAPQLVVICSSSPEHLTRWLLVLLNLTWVCLPNAQQSQSTDTILW